MHLTQSAILLVVGLSILTPLSTARAAIIFGGHEYLLTASAKNWTAAEAEAVLAGGHLVAVNNAAEQSFLESNFLTGNFAGVPLWIGLNDAANEGTFVWSNGDPLSYTKWQSGEPNNSGVENYVAMNWHHALSPGGYPLGTWNDTPLNGTSGFGGGSNGPYFGIIERDIPAAVPEPATLTIWGLGALGCAVAVYRRKRLAT